MEYVADTQQNPFGMKPPCEEYVPGFGDSNAHFHIIGDSPATHGGDELGIPFTGKSWSSEFFDALKRGGLVQEFDLSTGDVETPGTYLSYLAMCLPPDGGVNESMEQREEWYDRMEPFFDAELRAITAHVLLPVGERATKHVFETYSSMAGDGALSMADYHATDVSGAGWLIVPIKDPGEWDDGDADNLVERLRDLLDSDYRQISDLGRFQPDSNPYFVR